MPAERFSKDQAAKELKRAKKLARSSRRYVEQARSISRKLHREEIPDDEKIAAIYMQLVKGEKDLAKLLKPAKRGGSAMKKKRGRTVD